MAKTFDTTTKLLFDRYVRDWFGVTGWPLPADERRIAVVDSDLSTVARMVDKLVRVDDETTPYLAHFEFQTKADPNMDRRMLMYNVLAADRHKLPVRGVVLLFTPESAVGPTGRVYQRFDDSTLLEYRYRLIRLWDVPTVTWLNGPLGTLPLAPLSATKAELPAVIDRVADRIRLESPPTVAAELFECVRLLGGVRFDKSLMESLMGTFAEMLESSSTYQATLGRGRAEGELIGRRQQLLRQGTAKFGRPSAGHVARLEAISDLGELDDLAVRLLHVSDWDQLLPQS